MNKYNEVEIQTAKNLLKKGYKWLDKKYSGTLYAYKNNPGKAYAPDNTAKIICASYVPIFESINIEDAPTSLERIVHPQILDDDEKKYLSAVIKPFRGNVTNIIKGAFEPKQEFISIYYKNGEATFLPCFEARTMYKGMERHRRYTLEELGL